jgi:predicted small lipoprotein YifL
LLPPKTEQPDKKHTKEKAKNNLNFILSSDL